MGDLNGANWLLMSEYERSQLKDDAILELDRTLTNDQSCDIVQEYDDG